MQSLKASVCGLILGTLMSSAPLAAGQNNDEPAAEPATEYVRMKTSKGEIVVELFSDKAPATVRNFLAYVDKGFYDGTIFHRVIDGFMIQGGGYTADLQEKPTDPPITNEWGNGLTNQRGTIAMARTNDPHSATSQFFINVVDNPRLDQPISGGMGYAVFGRVIAGMDVVDKIKSLPTQNKGPAFANLPVETVVIESVKRTARDELSTEITAAKESTSKSLEEAFNAGIEFVRSRVGDISGGTRRASGLWYVETEPGEGERPGPTSTVKVHYTGWLTDGTRFDSSVVRGQPATLALNRVIKGWTECVQGMKPGGKRYVVIPPDLGYGEKGAPGVIPPNAVLVFQIELLEVVTR